MKPVVVVIEDNQDIRSTIRRFLVRRNYEIREAASGEEALLLLENVCPDLILLDVGLPQMDGIETARHIRRLTKSGQVPILFLTAHTSVDNIERMQQSGRAEFMLKPFDFDALLARIESILKLDQKGSLACGGAS